MLYPLNLELSGRRCTVIGGGRVAERKIGALLAAGAVVTVIAPTLTDRLQQLAAKRRLHWEATRYRPGMLAASTPVLVFCTADDRQANGLAVDEAKAIGALVNAAAEPKQSDFQVPSQIHHGDFLLTVSTGGGSPAFSRLLREQLEEEYPKAFGQFIERLVRIRQELRDRGGGSMAHQAIWRKVMDKRIIELVRAGQLDLAEEEIRHGIIDAGVES